MGLSRHGQIEQEGQRLARLNRDRVLPDLRLRRSEQDKLELDHGHSPVTFNQVLSNDVPSSIDRFGRHG